jgi:acyl-coenzyme A thioesterase PaaI-like protein
LPESAAPDHPLSMREWLHDLTRVPDEPDRSTRELASVMRDLTRRLVASDSSREQLRAAAELVRQATALLDDPRPVPEHRHGERSSIFGQSNPISPPLVVAIEDGDDGPVVVGRVTFGQPYEGPPGHVHGGWIAAVFDEVLGLAQAITDSPGMTGRLTVRYRAPTPLHTELVLRGRVTGVQGRKIHTEATLHAGDVLCAEADGLFVSVDFTRLAG